MATREQEKKRLAQLNANKKQTKKNRVIVPRERIWELLNEQLANIESSINAYDLGTLHEAKRIAAAIRILVHDTHCSHSLLKQLNLKSRLKYSSTAFKDAPGNLLSFHGLVGIKMHVDPIPELSKTTYERKVPLELNLAKHLTFDDWWNEVVLNDRKGGKFTRKSLVLAVANQDGGSHVDPEMDEDYYKLTAMESMGITKFSGPVENHVHGVPLDNKVELESIVAIGDELVRSIRRHIAESSR
ncbi:MAG: hypothetical protein A2X86_17680 [Bdellovibrionales bacterium GWA2_49_15]|nr:MAG: hypothetical protein A2X86_17680 [Bdellovibrionales bacterium GWA2_49_15]